MILSVVIVSYNVKYFLEQCLSSLKKAIDTISIPHGGVEVFIVDNASADDTPGFLEPLFPDYRFVRNKENNGFAKANNLALPLCHGEFVLFLNPDTILAEDTLDLCIRFFRESADAGAVGVQMIDGAGHYLRESKRGFPSPSASFFKMTGLARLFPRSKTFSSYYMGHLNKNEIHSVDVLSGAFMLIRKKILDETGGFDEQFFMYAEDIDLSYRISQAGYRNYYLSQTTIIHFKGESTGKDIRYVNMFYSAMQIFAKKHFSNKSRFRFYILSLGLRMRQLLAFVSLPFIRSGRKLNNARPVFIKGSPSNEEKIKQKLKAGHMAVTEKEKSGDSVIYCEGLHFPWKTIIQEIGNNTANHLNYFYGHGTHAIVGSHSGKRQGEMIEL